MKTKNLLLSLIRWTARISGTSVLAFVLFFVFAHLFGDENGPGKTLTTVELLSVSFGIGMLLGLLIGLFKEGIGGLVATISLMAFFIVRSDLIMNSGIIGLFIIPGLLYLVYWYLNKRNLRSTVIETDK